MKQAVVLIHGIGEQVPMDTLRGFVEAVWIRDSSLRWTNAPSEAWSKPDEMSRNFELRRLTTAKNREGVQTDFFEFYWAHLMEGTRLSHVWAWVKVLLLRSPSRVPQQLRPVWWFLVIFGGLLIVAWINHLFGKEPTWIKWLWIGAHVIWLVVAGFLIHFAGDAVRYLYVAPPNIEKRRLIREAGIRLLKTLHEAKNEDGSRKYNRIILVGHSLGSVIGYDILTHLWPQYNTGYESGNKNQSTKALDDLEDLAQRKTQDKDFVENYQTAQSAYLEELRAQGNKWLITDFVTLGSPLAHGILLLARTEKEFDLKKQQREFPTCPPILETISDKHLKLKKFTFKAGETWLPHHAAVFGPTRWTNLYFPCQFVLWGDLIGGKMVSAFGAGIRDIAVKTNLRLGIFSHTLYWSFPTDKVDGIEVPSWIVQLRKAVRILSVDTTLNPTQDTDII
jgi:hypothetical protein